MARENGPIGGKGGKTVSRSGAKAVKRGARILAPELEVAGPTPSAALEAALEEDDRVRAVLTRHLEVQAKATQPIAARARKAFGQFKPSLFTPGQRVKRNYLKPGEKLAQSIHAVIEKGVADLRTTAGQRTLKILLDDESRDPITSAPANRGRIPLQPLIDFFRQKLGDVPTLRTDPTFTACEAEAKAKAVLDEIDRKTTPAGLGTAANTEGGGGRRQPVEVGRPPSTKEFVTRQVHDLMAKLNAPEDQLRFEVTQKRAELADTESGVDTFQLRAGASDVVSYHDFSVLQIAFEHIWTEIFDSRLKDLGMQLYHTYIEELDFRGWKPDPARRVTSIDDIQGLLRDIRTLSGVPPAAGSDAIHKGDTVQNQLLSTATRDDASTGVNPPALFEGAARLSSLMNQMETLLQQKYAFVVFAEDSYNFGIMVTYRQTWRPERYQVGDLVSTIPLAPREIRRYTTRRVVKKTRAVKALEDALRTTRSDSSSTSRVEREIVDKAQQKTDFDVTTHGSFGAENSYKADVTARAGGEQASQSEKAKKHFHEAVLKSAQEYRQQNRMEIDTTASEEAEDTTFHEIQNPNDELTVTYMFYELQRTYRISEKIHQLTPVILVANKMPAPDGVDDAWLMRHDWILRRVILDDSFKPAVDYLTKSFVGAELNLRVLNTNAQAHKQLVDELKTQIKAQIATLEAAQKDLAKKQDAQVGTQIAEGFLGTVKRVFDPLQITGKEVMGTGEGVQAMVDFAQEGVDRAEREKARLLDQLGAATTALQAAIDRLSAATKEHYDRVQEIDRLRIHVKENILYYMQAIWSHEPRDQRFFRIYNIDVLIIEPDTTGVTLPLNAVPADLVDALRGHKRAGVTMPMPPVKFTKKKLVEVADLDTVLGYKGNYAIYALNDNNYVTLHMMQDYLEVSDTLKLRDPDDFGNYTVEQLQRLAECMISRDREGFEKYRGDFKDLIIKRLTSGRTEDDRVIVPTSSLYVEALVGTHPLLEDFKLLHRALDVRKVQADVRHAELENIRLAARALDGKTEDPDVDKNIVIQAKNTTVAVQPEG